MMQDLASSLRSSFETPRPPLLLGNSAPMRAVLAWLRRAARHRAPVLLCGETGTGKDIAARTLVALSARARAPFVALNCGGFAPQLMASELFGHERGAFTGAVAHKLGAFASAHGGSLFLDEVGEMPLDLQPQLLRALESGEVRHVGSMQSRHYDVRIIAATNRHLSQEVDDGRFRADLFHRLHVLVLELPPLRQRLDDLPELVLHFCSDAEARVPHLTEAAWEKLRAHPWPGNVRELKHVLARAQLVCDDGRIDADDIVFAPALRGGPLGRTLAQMERDAILKELQRQCGNRSATAIALGCSRSTMYRRLREFGLLPQGV